MTQHTNKHGTEDTDLKPAFVYATTRDWEGYFKAIDGREPRATLIEALELFEREPVEKTRFAIDLGCGEGRDPSRLTMQLAPFEAVELPECDLVNASFSLPFCRPEHYDTMWQKIVSSIRTGGRFSGQFFGDRDSWAQIEDRSHHTREQVDMLLEPFTVELMKVEERKGQDCDGTKKDWHVFHVVARKDAE